MSLKQTQEGVVLEGFLVKGKLFVDDVVFLGPTQDGEFLWLAKKQRKREETELQNNRDVVIVGRTVR